MESSLLRRIRYPHTVSAVLAALLASISILAAQSSTPALPALGDLEKLTYSPSPVPDLSGVPSHSDLIEIVSNARNYLRGVKLVGKFQEPILTRGAQGIFVFRKASPAVVCVVAGNVPGGEFTPLGVGTGVIVDPAGYVLTNWHVVGGFQAAIVFLKPSAGSEPRKELGYWVRAVAYDSAKDLALLKMLRPPTGLPTVKLGDFSQIQVAQDIHVIGHPGGVEHAWTYTTGVVSQIRRSYEAQFSDQTIHADLLQIQTAINPGNSGGPVLDDQGRMIGLVSFGMPKMQNMNFAIAADEIAAFLSRSLAARTRGVPAPASEEPKATYLAARFEDGRQVIKAQYGDATVYVVRTQESKPIELVCKTNDGVVLQGLEPGLTGGFNKWLITMSDGTALEASGKAGLPEVFVGK